tara:strand:- start:4675 stop:5403 length:729 start_codon:yes stop_codon:yes gene_type:complete
MAVSVDTVYQRVLALANKEQRGYITPQEFNLLANQAQMTIFESYFYHRNAREVADAGKSAELDETNISELIDMKLRPFSRVLGLNDSATVYPTTITSDGVAYPIFKTGRVFHGGRVAQKVSLNELQDIIRSTRHSLAINSPIYADSNVDGDDIIVINAGATVTSSVDVECFRIPVPVSWAYVVVNGKALYNSYAAVDFELHRAEEDTLVNKVLELAGIVINKTGLTTTISQLAAGEQQLQNQ